MGEGGSPDPPIRIQAAEMPRHFVGAGVGLAHAVAGDEHALAVAEVFQVLRAKFPVKRSLLQKHRVDDLHHVGSAPGSKAAVEQQ